MESIKDRLKFSVWKNFSRNRSINIKFEWIKFTEILRKPGLPPKILKNICKELFLSLNVVSDLSGMELGGFLETVLAVSLPRMFEWLGNYIKVIEADWRIE